MKINKKLKSICLLLSASLLFCSCSEKTGTAYGIKISDHFYAAGESLSLNLSGAEKGDSLLIQNDGKTLRSIPLGRNDNSLQLEGLPEGFYKAALADKNGNVLDETSFAVTNGVFSMNASSFTEGEPMKIYCPVLSDSAWIGIYPEGSNYGLDSSLLWIWNKDIIGGCADLNEFNHGGSALPLSPGNYTAILFSDGYEVESSFAFAVTPAEKDTLYYYNDMETPGSAEGSITLLYRGEPSAGYYAVYWGDSEGALDGYSPIFTHSPGKGESQYTFHMEKATAVPRGADRLILYRSVEEGSGLIFSDCFFLADPLLQTTEEPLYSFAVFSDTHVTSRSSTLSNQRTKKAFLEIQELAGDSLAAVFVNGDLTNNGKEMEYKQFSKLASLVKVPLYCSIGNHDLGLNQVSYQEEFSWYSKATGMTDPYYAISDENCTYIILGSEDAQGLSNNMALISPAQISWLKEQLDRCDPDKPVFIFLHQPIQNTVEASETRNITSNDLLAETINAYPNVIMFCGHIHMTMKSMAVVDGKGEAACYVNDGSIASTWINAYEEIYGSEGILVEVYSDRILIRSRDFLNDCWIGGYEFMLKTK